MQTSAFLFYMFAAIAILSAARVITARNPVHAVLFLVLTFFNVSGLWILLQAEFLAIALIMVYVGAVMVLFLFVVMMLDIDIERVRRGFVANLWIAVPFAIVLVIEMGIAIIQLTPDSKAIEAASVSSNTKALGAALFTDYVYPFELASIILTVAIIAAVLLTLRKRKGRKSLDPAQQIHVKASDRLRIVSMPSHPASDPSSESKEAS